MPDVEHGLESSDDEDNHKFKVPHGITMVQPDGTVEYQKLGLATAQKAVICCGLPAPMGGWGGPFGFYRILSYLFILVSILSLVLLILAFCWGLDWLDFFDCVVLMGVAIICAYAAYAHEGLAREVSEIAQQNDRFSHSNDELQKKIVEMSGVGDRLDDISKSMAMSEDKLGDTITVLKKLTTCEQLTTVLSAFIDADSEGDHSQQISDDEAKDFMKTVHGILEEACPDRDFHEMRDAMEESGLDLGGVRMLINGVASSGLQCPKKSRAEMDLVMFSLNAKENIAKVKQSVWAVIADDKKGKRTEKQVKAQIQALADEHTEHDGGIDCGLIVPLSKDVMAVPNKDKSRGLCKPTLLTF